MRYYTYKINSINVVKLVRKIKIISNEQDEFCRYIIKLFNSYMRYMCKDSLNLNYSKIMKKRIDQFDIDDNVLFTYSGLNIIENIAIKCLDEKLTLIYFVSEKIDNNLIELLEKIKSIKNLKLILIGKFDTNKKNKLKKINQDVIIDRLSINKIEKKLELSKTERILMLVDINTLKNVNNWYTSMKEKTEMILKTFISYNDKEISDNPSNISKMSIFAMLKQHKTAESVFKISLPVLMKYLIKIQDFCYRKNIKYGLNYNNEPNNLILAITNLQEINDNNCVLLTELVDLIKTSSYLDKKDRYNHIYDIIYNYLENDIKMYNYCDFKDGRCVAKRDKYNKINYPKSEYDGCCYDLKTLKKCRYLENNSCKIECISCRLFTCKYLKVRGVDYNINNNLQIKCFMNLLYRPELVWSFFTDKKEILKRFI